MSGFHFAREGLFAKISLVIVIGLGSAPLLSAVDADEKLISEIKADVSVLADTIGPRSVFQGATLARTAAYIETRFEALGWSVKRHGYLVSGRICDNLEVERIGTTRPHEIVVVGAHYDSVVCTPGADDNASGVAGVLALAKLLADSAPERTLRLVAFVNEEPIYFQTALMGSRVYARGCRERGDRITAMLSLETIGYFADEEKSQKYPFPLSLFYPSRGTFIAIVGNRASGELVKHVATRLVSTKLIPVEKAALPGGLQGVGWSDHWAFWQEGYPAVMVTDTAPFRNHNYHRPGDTPDTLDYVRMAAVVRGLEAVVNDLVSYSGDKE